jgi:D-3-phosphoglycerate dehydrogenase
MKIVLADTFPDAQAARLAEAGHECITAHAATAGDLPELLHGADVLVVRSTRVTAETLEAADRLALVVRAGAGVNTIDTEAAGARGIYVANTPGKNALAVAELTIGLLTALDRRIPDAVADLRAGRWRKSEYSRAAGLAGRRLGIIGTGAIGKAVAQRARAFEMQIAVEDKPGRAAGTVAALDAIGCLRMDRDTLLSTSDAVTIHVPAAPDTVGMVDAAFLARMRHGAFLINTSRGDILDEAALLEVIDDKELRVGLDVYAVEPGSGIADFDSPLARHPRVYGTHHIGASTDQAQSAIADEVVDIIEGFARGDIRNCVNLDAGTGPGDTITVRHVNRVGVLVKVLGELRDAGLNVAQMSNRVFAGGQAAIATIHVDGVITARTMAAIRTLDEVIGATVPE